MAFTDQFFGLAEEGTWGTAAARTEWSGVHGSSFLRRVKDRQTSALITSGDITRKVTRLDSADGLIETNLVYKGMRTLMAFLFNIPDASIVDGGTSPDFTHQYKLGPVGPGYTAEMHYGFPDSGLESMLAAGCKTQTVTFTFVDGQEVLLSGTFNGKPPVQAAKSTQTLPDYDTHTIDICQITCEIDDVVAPVTGVTINVDHKLTSRSRLNGSCDLSEQERAPEKREITGTLTAEWDDKTIYDLFANETPFKLEVLGVGPLIGGGPETFAFSARLNNCVFDTDPHGINDGGITTRGLTFASLADATFSPLEIIITNDAASG